MTDLERQVAEHRARLAVLVYVAPAKRAEAINADLCRVVGEAVGMRVLSNAEGQEIIALACDLDREIQVAKAAAWKRPPPLPRDTKNSFGPAQLFSSDGAYVAYLAGYEAADFPRPQVETIEKMLIWPMQEVQRHADRVAPAFREQDDAARKAVSGVLAQGGQRDAALSKAFEAAPLLTDSYRAEMVDQEAAWWLRTRFDRRFAAPAYTTEPEGVP